MMEWMQKEPTAFGVVLFDLWGLLNAPDFHKMNLACWTPVDHAPVPPLVYQFLSDGKHHAIAMSRFGEEMLLDAGQPREELTYIPHAFDMQTFRDVGMSARQRLGIPESEFVVSTVAANRGKQPCRKGFGEMADAMALFMKDRPDVSWYIHTEPLGLADGVNLPRLLAYAGVDRSRVRYPHPSQLRNGMPDEALADLYSSSNAHLLLSMGEGVGCPVIESQACGVPNVVTDATAQRELIGPHGKRIRAQRSWDEYQSSWFFIANVDQAYTALQELYEETKAGAVDRKAVAASVQEYDADLVYQTKWKPLIERMSERGRRR